MVYSFILFSITLTGLLVGTITDLKTREVPDWLSYGLIFTGLSLNLLFSITHQNYLFILNSIAGFIAFFIIALIMFYTGQWGGGDSKVLMGLGALIGLDITFSKMPFLLSLFVNIILVGSIYGLFWSTILVIRKWKPFSKEFKKIYSKIKYRNYLLIASIIILILGFTPDNYLKILIIALPLLILSLFYLWVSVKSIEKTCMIKSVTPDKLTEGDWIVKDIKHKGKYICGPKDLGIEKKQIRQLVKLYKQNKIKRILIKEGIPFVPSFLIAYLLTLFYGNLFLLLL